MAATTATKNAMADYWASRGTTYSLHTGDPGGSGTSNEATGGGYSRQSTTWGSASAGVVTGSQLTFPVAAGNYTHMARWNGSTFLGSFDTTDAVVSPAGEVKVTPSYTYNGTD